MNKIKKSIFSTVGFKFQIKRIYDYIKFIANRNEKLIASEILEFVQEKLNQPSNSSEKPTQLFLEYNIKKGAISSKCFRVD